MMFIEKDSDRIKRFLWSAIVFIVIAALIKMNNVILTLADSLIQDFFAGSKTGLKTGIMSVVSFLGEPKMSIIYAFVIAFLLWGFKYKIPALWTLGTVIGGDVVAYVVKKVVQRDRPVQHLKADDGYSFPSGHTFGMFLIIAILFIIVVPLIQSGLKRFLLEAILMIFMLLLAVSRVYLYAHFPSDVIGAMLLAYTWLQVTEWMYVWLAPMLKRWRFVSNSEI